MTISLVVFFFFSKFLFFGLLGGSKGKKWPKMTKNSVLCTLKKPFLPDNCNTYNMNDNPKNNILLSENIRQKKD